VGGATGLLAAALVTGLGGALWVAILQSLAGVAAITILLRRYYANSPTSVVDVMRKPAEG
jgi:hypothetical protein